MSKKETSTKETKEPKTTSSPRYTYIGPVGSVIVVPKTRDRFRPDQLKTDADVTKLLKHRPELKRYFSDAKNKDEDKDE